MRDRQPTTATQVKGLTSATHRSVSYDAIVTKCIHVKTLRGIALTHLVRLFFVRVVSRVLH